MLFQRGLAFSSTGRSIFGRSLTLRPSAIGTSACAIRPASAAPLAWTCPRSHSPFSTCSPFLYSGDSQIHGGDDVADDVPSSSHVRDSTTPGFGDPASSADTQDHPELQDVVHSDSSDVYIVGETIREKLGLSYPLQDLQRSTPTPSGYRPPLGGTDHLPFRFTRTKFGNLPVYSDVRNGGTRKLTILRRLYGDVNEVIKELKKVTGESNIVEKQGSIEVKGSHVRKVKMWLLHLGF